MSSNADEAFDELLRQRQPFIADLFAQFVGEVCKTDRAGVEPGGDQIMLVMNRRQYTALVERFYEDGLSTGWAQALFAVMDAREIDYPDEVVEQIFRSDLDELDAWACRVAVARTALDLC